VASSVGDERLALALAFLLFAVGMIIQTWLATGVFRGMLRIARGKRVPFDVVFSGARYLVTIVLAGIVVVLIFLAVYIAIGLTVGFVAWWLEGPIIGLLFLGAFVVYAVVMLYLSARLLQFFYVIIDERAGVFDSCRRSWQLTEKRAGTVIAIYLLLAANLIAGLLACGIGLIVAVPFNTLILAVTYLALAGKLNVVKRVRASAEEEL